MPAEYIERGFTPEHVTVEDSLTLALMSLKLWGEYHTGEELFNLIKLFGIIRQNGVLNGWKIFNDLYPLNDPGAVTTLDGDFCEKPQKISNFPPFYPKNIITLAQKVIDKFKSFNQFLKLLINYGI